MSSQVRKKAATWWAHKSVREALLETAPIYDFARCICLYEQISSHCVFTGFICREMYVGIFEF